MESFKQNPDKSSIIISKSCKANLPEYFYKIITYRRICGHCIAVCPHNAVAIDNLGMNEVLELKDVPCDIDPEIFLNHLKARRTIRSFINKTVSADQINMILDAGRFSPTGGNRQMVAYHVF